METSNRIQLWKRMLVLVLSAALVCALAPLYGAAAYSRAGVDDYRYGYRTHEAWTETGSPAAVLAAAGEEAAATYTEWQGSYAAIFLMALEPGAFSDGAYGLSTWLLLTAFVAGMLYFLTALFRRLLGMPRWAAAGAGIAVTLAAVQFVPSPCEAFFWFNGGVYYTFFFSLSLFAAGLLLRRTDRKTAAQWVLLPIIGVLIGGGNLVTAFLCCGLLLLYALWMLLRRKLDACVLVTLAVLAAAFLVNALAPGNGVRQAEHAAEAASGPLAAIVAALCDAARYGGKWLLNPASLFSLALLPLYWTADMPAYTGAKAQSGKARLLTPVLATVGAFLLLAAGFTPTEYALGQAGEGRLLNIQYDMFLILWNVVLCLWTGWVRRVTETRRAEGRGRRQALSGRRLAGAVVALALLLGAAAALVQRTGASVSAVRILLNGSAASYREGWEERFDLLYDGEKADVVLPRLENKPPLLCLMDVVPEESDENYWYNEQLERYFHKDRVLTEPEEE